MKKAFFTLAVALLAATGAWAQTTFTAENLKYKVTDETTHTVELTGYVTKPTGTLTIPATVTNESTEYSVTSIGSSAFSWCSQLTAVTIPEGVATIGSSAFESCSSLTAVTIPASVTNIGSWVFDYCSALTAIHVAEGNTAYSSEDGVLFNKDKTTLVCYPIGKTETTYTVPATVTTIETSAFEDCTALTQVTLPEGLTNISNMSFEGCAALAQINLPNSLTSIANRAFYGCTSLTEVTLPDGLTKIEFYTFYDCSALEKVTLPEGITYIGNEAFKNCSALTEMTVLATTPPTLGTDVFLNVSRTIPVYVPAASLAAYQAAAVWNEFNLQAIGTTGLPTAVMPESIRMHGGLLHNPQQLHLTLYDMQGRQVYSGTDATVSQPAGVYVLRCAGASGKVVF
ncbi:MAG: leucine-rich repeat domain-containing protein [Bacteroidetes bacterium]|uniref:Leucine-rich repeat domain-containing protein n=1 Tax=Candidatus Gallipaludibacter merdavium TaxID=2840839 RepID=A0A9D9N3L1_9BACT|nr:leucine-rich repeat domain-containing protein [Candidatus Gallipaludibacter merdavium]